MSKKKSIVLLVLIVLVIVVLTLMTFVSFALPGSVKDFNSIIGAMELEQDLGEGYTYTYEMKDELQLDDSDVTVEDVLKEVRERVEFLGYSGAEVYAYKQAEEDDYRLRITLRGLKIDGSVTTPDADVQAIMLFGDTVFTDGDGNTLFDQDGIVNAYTQTLSGSHYVALELTKSAADQVAGKTITAKIGDTTVITSLDCSDFSGTTLFFGGEGADAQSMRRTAAQLKFGGMPLEYEAVDSGYNAYSVLGVNAVMDVTLAFVIAVAVIMVLFLVFYRGFGLVSDLTIFSFVLVELLFLILIPGVVLSLASVLGILFATLVVIAQMAVLSSNVKKEYAMGKTIRAAVKTGYRKGIFAILDMTAVLGIGTILMLILGGSAMFPFAVTFGVGLIIGALATMFLSQLLLKIIMALPRNQEKFFCLKREEEVNE